MKGRVSVQKLKEQIKAGVMSHLKKLGFKKTDEGYLRPPGNSKRTLRRLHRAQRVDVLEREDQFIETCWKTLRTHFADGFEVEVEKIKPRLELIHSGTWQANLFRLATLTWSVPVSQGYGRRLRFLVWDENNTKLIGLIGLGDPVFNLRVRDEWIGWDADDRRRRLVNVMDAFVLGAVPPYNRLLAGKLLACLVRTTEVRDAFRVKYADAKGVISKKRKRAHLVLVTTSSALGRSSVYNRLSLDGHKYFISLGYTSGWGHFHIPDKLFDTIRQYLKQKGDAYFANHDYGDGPNWKLRAVRKALSDAGVDPGTLHHGIEREVFACPLAKNVKRVLSGEVTRPAFDRVLSVSEVGGLAKERWLIPRAQRVPEFACWEKSGLLKLLRAPLNGR